MVLECDEFSLEVGDLRLSGNGFSLERGQIAYLYGLSGSGASDFLFILAGLHNIRGLSSPAAGDRILRTAQLIDPSELAFLRLLSKPIYEYPPAERARHIGFIFEDPDLFIVGRTILEDLRYSFAANGKAAPEPSRLKSFGLYEKMDRRTEILSGGEKHRLNCASVLSLTHSLILADFSYSNLDPEFVQVVINLFEGRAKEGSSLIIHGLPITPNKVDKSLVIENGVLYEKSPDRSVFPSPPEERTKLSTLFKPRATTGKSVLSVDSLGRRDRITFPVSFQVYEGEVVQIWGPNGCGKTSLAKAIAGLFQDTIGTSSLLEGVIPALCLQNPERQFIESTVWKEIPDEDLLKTIEIDQSSWSSHPRSLPRSRQKLLGISLALCMSEGLSILDEPTSGMDHPSKQLFIRLLNKYHTRSVLIFTHDEALRDIGRRLNWEEITI